VPFQVGASQLKPDTISDKCHLYTCDLNDRALHTGEGVAFFVWDVDPMTYWRTRYLPCS